MSFIYTVLPYCVIVQSEYMYIVYDVTVCAEQLADSSFGLVSALLAVCQGLDFHFYR